MTEKFELGRTGLEVFPLGFGGIPIQRVSEEKAVEVVREAVNQGVNFIDSARAYGDSEEKIGKALQGVDEGVYLASKTPAKSAEKAFDDVQKSLDNFRVDCIELYQLHNVSSREDYQAQVTDENSALAGLKKARQEGLIEHIGITGHSGDLLLKAIEEYEFATIQFCYNFIEREAEDELIPSARSLDLGLIAMKPLAGGRLRRADISLKYIFNRKNIIPIPGMETVAEVKENAGIFEQDPELKAADYDFIAERRQELGDQFCRRCGYCLPCPEEINIPVVLRVESFLNRMPAGDIKEGPYETFLEAKNCTECYQCVDDCPYDLPIPRLLQENMNLAVEELE